MSLIKISKPKQRNNKIDYQQKSFGVDFGTTTSLASIYEDGKNLFVECPKTKSRFIQSIVSITKDHDIIIGDQEDLPSETVTLPSLKRILIQLSSINSDVEFSINEIEGYFDTNGIPYLRIHGKSYSIIELVSEVIKKIKYLSANQLGKELNQAIITVPAHMNEKGRQWTSIAFAMADINIIRIINEPTAAILNTQSDSDKDKVYLVYDLGGGTFDVSIVRVIDGIFKVISTEGDQMLGGDDFDRKIADHLGVDIAQARELKHQLTKEKEVIVGNKTFTNADLLKISEELLNKTLDKTLTALKAANVEIELIETIIMAGGSAKMKIVKDFISKNFPDTKIINKDNEFLVVSGAAKKAASLDKRIPNNLLLDITPLSLGIEGAMGTFEKIIHKNSSIPISSTQTFTNSHDNQTGIKINIFQGESSEIKDCMPIGAFEINFPSAKKMSLSIDVNFKIDNDGILVVSCLNQDNGEKIKTFEVKPLHHLTREEIVQLLKKGRQ